MRIKKENSLLLVVDVQERLFPHIEDHVGLGKKILTLLEGLKALDVPMLAARQYPKGLGNTIAELQPYFSEYHDKMTFSCCGEQTILSSIQNLDRKNVIVIGVEAHVCVLQTVIDLKARGFVPVVVTDAIGSRSGRDYEVALRRMEYEGAILTTVESILFELCRQAGSEAFKVISRVVK